MTALEHQIALASRAPDRALAAVTAEALLDVLSDTLHGAYRNLRRYELYVSDQNANLVPVPGLAGARRRRTGALLSSLKESLLDQERGLARAHRQADEDRLEAKLTHPQAKLIIFGHACQRLQRVRGSAEGCRFEDGHEGYQPLQVNCPGEAVKP